MNIELNEREKEIVSRSLIVLSLHKEEEIPEEEIKTLWVKIWKNSLMTSIGEK